MIMEDNGNVQPSYDELVRNYNAVYQALQRTEAELFALRQDKVLERLNTLITIMSNKDKFPKTIVDLAKWHIEQILAKPQEATK